MSSNEHTERKPKYILHAFPPEVTKEAHAVQFGPEFFQGRREVQGLTIDGPTSRDLDDAIWLEPTPTGHTLTVSIADVSSAVTPGSGLDSEAYQRTSTQYFATGNKPMIPRQLSENSLSLLEAEKRPTITVSISLDHDGEMREVSIEQTFLVSQKKHSYQEIDKAIQNPDHPSHTTFAGYYAVAEQLLRKRRSLGALAIYDIFKGIATTEEGNIFALEQQERHLANVIVQEFMILTNQAVAQYFAENNIPALFRNHTAKFSAPGREKLMQDIQSATDYPNKNFLTALQKDVAITLNKATYGPQLQGHYGLNLPAYVHFTSPIRRYADLVNHRILIASLNGEPLPYSFEQLQEIGEHINSRQVVIKTNREESFKEKAYDTARETRNKEQLQNTDDTVFINVIKWSAQLKQMNEAVCEEIITRLVQDRLTNENLFLLFFRPQERNEYWERIHREVLRWIISKPHLAPSIVNIANQKSIWTTVQYETKRGGWGHSNLFTTQARVKHGDTEIISKLYTADSVKISEQLALIALLALMVGQQEVLPSLGLSDTPEAPEVLKTEAKVLVTKPPMKNVLQELCVKHNLPFPTYQVQVSGPSHLPSFTVTVEVFIQGVKFASEPMRGSSKKEAEAKAAANLLEQLGVDLEEATQQNETQVEVEGENYVGALQTLAQRRKWKIPTYQETSSDRFQTSGFNCTVILKTDAGIITAKASSSRKKDARQEAAKALLEKITQLR